jgi:uncharacterized protein with HXXEE motif
VTWLWWAPLAAAALHIGEEFVYPGGFAAWDRAYRPEYSGSITPGLHVVVNALLLAACATVGIAGMPGGAIAVGGVRFRSAIPAALAAPAWLAMTALLFSNALYHLAGTIKTKRVSPGLRTGLLLYVPLALGGSWYFLGTGQLSVLGLVVSASIGGSYHLWASLGHRWRSRRAAA